MIKEINKITMLSKNLETSIHKTLVIAAEFRHEYSTFRTFIISFKDDKDAQTILIGCGVKIDKLKNNLKNFLMNDMFALINNNIIEIKPTSNFESVIHSAIINAHSCGIKEIT